MTDYLGGFQYLTTPSGDGGLKFFPTAEGYVSVTNGDKFNYVFNYTDHLGNIRVSYSIDPADQQLKILEENHYYPFGLKHKNYNTNNTKFAKDDIGIFAILKAVVRSDYQYKYNGKEFQDELGLNFYDYGARNYDAATGRWMNMDPLAETSRRFSPYTYCLNNPLRFIDPDGMEADDVILTGTKTKEALAELQKSVGSDITLSMDENGKVDYQRNGEGPLTENASDLVGAIDDHSVTAEVNTSNNDYASNGDPLIGNQMGATVNSDGTATGHQEINPEALSRMDNINGLPGQTTLHETMEAYTVGNTAKNTGQNITAATIADAQNSNSPYSKAHNGVVPQSGNVWIYDQNGKPIPNPSQSISPNTTHIRYATGNPLHPTQFHIIKAKR